MEVELDRMVYSCMSLARGQTKTSVGVLRIHQCCLRFSSPGHALYRRMHSTTRITAHTGVHHLPFSVMLRRCALALALSCRGGSCLFAETDRV